jgi:hypothetical protein
MPVNDSIGGDSINGGSGASNDNLAGDAPRGGGAGNDTFRYRSTEGNDRIFDFSGAPATQDVLGLTEANAAQVQPFLGPHSAQPMTA